MAFKKTCRCGKIIDYNEKYCDKCAEYMHELKKENDRYYDKHMRKNKDVYHSKQWRKLTNEIKNKFKGIDIYAYYVLGELVYGDLSHHVIPINDDDSRKFDLDNLIWVSNSTHSIVHAEYDKGGRAKQDMQELLFSLIKRWEEENSIYNG